MTNLTIDQKKQEFEKYTRICNMLKAEKLTAKNLEEKKTIERALKIAKAIAKSFKN